MIADGSTFPAISLAYLAERHVSLEMSVLGNFRFRFGFRLAQAQVRVHLVGTGTGSASLFCVCCPCGQSSTGGSMTSAEGVPIGSSESLKLVSSTSAAFEVPVSICQETKSRAMVTPVTSAHARDHFCNDRSRTVILRWFWLFSWSARLRSIRDFLSWSFSFWMLWSCSFDSLARCLF